MGRLPVCPILCCPPSPFDRKIMKRSQLDHDRPRLDSTEGRVTRSMQKGPAETPGLSFFYLPLTLSIRNGAKLKCTRAKRNMWFGLREVARFPLTRGLDNDLGFVCT
jgi:hypothetical protein